MSLYGYQQEDSAPEPGFISSAFSWVIDLICSIPRKLLILVTLGRYGRKDRTEYHDGRD